MLPVVGAIAGKTEITSLWSMSAWTLLPVLLLSPPAFVMRPIETQRLLGIAIAVPIVMLIASPAIAWFTRDRVDPSVAQARLLAQEVDRDWKNTTPEVLRFVGGDPSLVDGVITWSADRPRALTNMPAPPAEELKRDGVALVCPSGRYGLQDSRRGCRSRDARQSDGRKHHRAGCVGQAGDAAGLHHRAGAAAALTRQNGWKVTSRKSAAAPQRATSHQARKSVLSLAADRTAARETGFRIAPSKNCQTGNSEAAAKFQLLIRIKPAPPVKYGDQKRLCPARRPGTARARETRVFQYR